MVKIPVAFQLSKEAIRTINVIKDSLMKSKNWIVENSIYNYGVQVNNFLAVEDDFREFLAIKKHMWKDDLYNEMLRYHLRKGFILKNSVRKICEMISSGVNQQHIQSAISVYEKLCTDTEYKTILVELKTGLINRKELDLEKIRVKLSNINKESVLY